MAGGSMKNNHSFGGAVSAAIALMRHPVPAAWRHFFAGGAVVLPGVRRSLGSLGGVH
jgi:hypothetical protein